ncbi:MAG: glutathione S-transferase family protein, partial [Planctomycetota bacterium]
DKPVNLLAGEQHAPEYRAINPRGEVPTLVHGTWTLTETSVINEYLAEAFPKPGFVPDDPQARAEMRYRVYRISDELHEACGVLSYAVAVRPMQLLQPRDEVLATIEKMPDPVKRRRRRTIFEQGIESTEFVDGLRRHVDMLRALDDCLGHQPWLIGSEFTIADASLIPYIVRLEHLRMSALLERAPNVAKWYEACSERPSFGSAIVDMMPAPVLQATRKAGEAVWPQVAAIVSQWQAV